MANDGLKELYIDELKDLYNAESQLVKALPKMAKSASWDQLRQGFEEHRGAFGTDQGTRAAFGEDFPGTGRNPEG